MNLKEVYETLLAYVSKRKDEVDIELEPNRGDGINLLAESKFTISDLSLSALWRDAS